MAERTIRCEDCGSPYSTNRSNTKFCDVCRLLRDLRFIGPSTHDCWVCQTKFAPITLREEACAEHGYHPAKTGECECVYCHETRPRIRANLAVCVHCARSVERRPMFVKALAIKQRERQAANQLVPAEAA